MDLGIEGKYALVTGAGRGLGRSIALNLAKEGAKVAAVSRTKSDLDDLLKKMHSPQNVHYVIACNLTEQGMPQKVVEELKHNFADPDILVNNLGGDLYIKDPFCPISDWQRIFRLNLEVTIELNNLLIPFMKEQKWGRIVNVSSIAALENQGAVPYCTVKAALTAYSRSMGRLLAPDGIVMTSILPGAVFTEKGYWDIASRERPEHVEKYLNERMAIKRFGAPDEIGTVVAFLCSQHASFFVGSTILVDGGQGKCFQNEQ